MITIFSLQVASATFSHPTMCIDVQRGALKHFWELSFANLFSFQWRGFHPLYFFACSITSNVYELNAEISYLSKLTYTVVYKLSASKCITIPFSIHTEMNQRESK